MAAPSARGYADIAAADATPENKQKAADALNRLAWVQVLSKDGAAAEASARQALTFSPNAAVVQMNLAHALLISGKRDEARAIYAAIQSGDAGEGRTLREVILADFDAMQEAGVPDDTIASVRAELGGGKGNRTPRRSECGAANDIRHPRRARRRNDLRRLHLL
jgi:hypothetical protein